VNWDRSCDSGGLRFAISQVSKARPGAPGVAARSSLYVWANLFDPRRLFPGDRFLMQGGTSGIGTFAIQAANAFGAKVASTAGSPEKCRFLRELGCERVLNYKGEDWVAGALEWSGAKGVDVILDMVGGDYFAKHLKLLAKDGRLVHIATMRGSEVSLDLRTVMAKRLMITGSTLRPRSLAEKRHLRDGVEEYFWPLVREGKIRPIVDQVFFMADVAKAHQRMESGSHIGKIVLGFA
jgi:NADPH2:quinone reductase